MVVLYLALSKHVNLGHIPLLVFLVFWHPRQVSSRLYRVQRRLKGHLRPLLACFTLPTLPGFYFIACSFQYIVFCPKRVAFLLCLLIWDKAIH